MSRNTPGAMSSIPPDLRLRLERAVRWRPETYETWWNQPVIRYGRRRPCELDEWELEELVRKLEDAAEFAARHRATLPRSTTHAAG